MTAGLSEASTDRLGAAPGTGEVPTARQRTVSSIQSARHWMEQEPPYTFREAKAGMISSNVYDDIIMINNILTGWENEQKQIGWDEVGVSSTAD